MKILILNPQIDAQHILVKGLRNRGAAVLLTATPDEAWQVLETHGTSIDLAVVHRESGLTGAQAGEPGMTFIERVKGDAAQADLPMVLTSNLWSDPEFANHQRGPFGVNGYLSAPFKEPQLIKMVEAILGQPISEETGGTRLASGAIPQSPPADAPGIALELEGSPATPEAERTVLTEASVIFQRGNALPNPRTTTIRLEEPPLESTTLLPNSNNATAPIELSMPGEGVGVGADVTPESPSLEPAASPVTEQFSSLALQGIEQATVIQPTMIQSAQGTGEIDSIEMDFSSPSNPSMNPLGTTGSALGGLPPLGSEPEPVAQDEAESLLARDLPYLFKSGNEAAPSSIPANAAFAVAPPLGDAVIPGGAFQSPDTETLKKYLLLREQDVAVLSSQLRSAKEHVASLESSLRSEQARSAELEHQTEEQSRRIDEFEREKAIALAAVQEEIAELRFTMKAKTDKAHLLETQVKAAADEMEKLKERVRSDIRKIRVREKELENRLEIVKKDSEALLASRETRIIELKRKLDLLEFNMDLLQDQYMREKETSAKLREKLNRAAQAVRVAGGLLDKNGEVVEPAGSATESAQESTGSKGKREAS